ncbi:MAG: response regulator [Lachnospiraceae bacterium]|nr:response regulator [Lachnospiraceae bacterium]
MKQNILVIDRDEEVFEHIRDAFENEVISVRHVYTAEEGLFRMRMKNYSLIVMDVALSEQSGRAIITAMPNHKAPMSLEAR